MEVSFSKYQGAGNDFIMLNNLDGGYNELDEEWVRFLCDRKFGIGADGLIRLNSHSHLPFEMDFFNPDGSKSFCGNGARCTVAFAEQLGFDVSNIRFEAIDGMHSASKHGDLISLEMNEVKGFETSGEDFILYTGSPHYIRFEKPGEEIDLVEFGRHVRYSDKYFSEGINVNLVKVIEPNRLNVGTYERGVENETLSCGTGVTACALAASLVLDSHGFQRFLIDTKGGQLSVEFLRHESGFSKIKLTGPAVFVFKGVINV
ncbi:MAG: hypothetical protein RIT43_2308 [Bacteroidota bacterium]|jgi:diaminopimelate epimerase